MNSQELIESGKSDISKGLSDAADIMHFGFFKFLNMVNVFLGAIACIIWIPVYILYMISESAWQLKNFLFGLPFPIIVVVVISLILSGLDFLSVKIFTNQKSDDEHPAE